VGRVCGSDLQFGHLTPQGVRRARPFGILLLLTTRAGPEVWTVLWDAVTFSKNEGPGRMIAQAVGAAAVIDSLGRRDVDCVRLDPLWSRRAIGARDILTQLGTHPQHSQTRFAEFQQFNLAQHPVSGLAGPGDGARAGDLPLTS